MTFLPILERELRVQARLPATYRNRVIVAGVFCFIGMIIFLFGAMASNPSEVGAAMFWVLAYLVLALCLLEGIRKTADCLSEEKREGTLGLLFLTDLKGFDIVLGKLAGTSLNSIYGLFSILPLLALPLLLGGVTPGEFWRVSLALVNILFLSLCAGMWASALSRAERRAMGGTFATIAIISAAPFVTKAYSFLSPLYAFHAASARMYSGVTTEYWYSIWLTQAVSWALLVWASLALPSSWQDEKLGGPASRWRFWQRKETDQPTMRAELRTDMLRINPAYWLAGRSANQRGILSVLIAAAAIASTMFIIRGSLDDVPYFAGAIWGINFTLKILIAFQACHCLAEARRNNSLEMLLVTPLTVEQIIRGQWLALKRAFFLPVIAILGLETIGLLGGLLTASYGKVQEGWAVMGIGSLTMAYLGLVVLDIFAVIWAGMWYGLSAKKEGMAAVKTILYVLVLPSCCMILACYGLPFLIGVPIFWISGGSQRLRHEFRRLAAQRYMPTPPTPEWTPIREKPPALPPVIDR